MIVVAQHLWVEVVDHFHCTDRHTVAIARTRVHVGQLAVQDAHDTSGALTPFFVDHATFLVDILCFEQERISPVVQDIKARVNVAVAHGHTVDVVHSFVGRSISVQVLTKLHTDAFAILHQAVAREMLSTVEAHVLQEVSQTALVVLFLHRTHLLCDIEVYTIFGQRIAAHVVSQAVFKFAIAHCLVDRQHGHLLCTQTAQWERHEHQQQKFDKIKLFHRLMFYLVGYNLLITSKNTIYIAFILILRLFNTQKVHFVYFLDELRQNRLCFVVDK